MRIAVIGAGYVGLVSGTCLAAAGHDVTCIDSDGAKIARLRCGDIPIYEPDLEPLLRDALQEGTLRFTQDLPAGIAQADVVFLTVGTPQGRNGSADLSSIWQVGDAIAAAFTKPTTIVIKSTVPVGTNAELTRRLNAKTSIKIDVASNPEFLKEGAAIADFIRPDRVVLGVRRPEIEALLRELYEPIVERERPFVSMSPESAEMTKYVANCLLATKISFINEMACLCSGYGADIDDVRDGIGHDRRIGFEFLRPGPGYGGSCFPKDVRAAIQMAAAVGMPARLLEAVDKTNDAAKQRFAERVVTHLGVPIGRRVVAVWGLAFKPHTDDIRESPALTLIDRLLDAGVTVRVTDPEAIPNVRRLYGPRLEYFVDHHEAAEGADLVAIVTDWPQYQRPDFQRLREVMREHSLFDGRNQLDGRVAHAEGFTYFGNGRRVCRGVEAGQSMGMHSTHEAIGQPLVHLLCRALGVNERDAIQFPGPLIAGG